MYFVNQSFPSNIEEDMKQSTTNCRIQVYIPIIEKLETSPFSDLWQFQVVPSMEFGIGPHHQGRYNKGSLHHLSLGIHFGFFFSFKDSCIYLLGCWIFLPTINTTVFST